MKLDAATAMAAATIAVVTVQKARAPKPVQHLTSADSHRKPCHPWRQKAPLRWLSKTQVIRPKSSASRANVAAVTVMAATAVNVVKAASKVKKASLLPRLAHPLPLQSQIRLQSNRSVRNQLLNL